MKHLILTTLLLITTLHYNLTAQQISSETYNKDYIHEDFNATSEYFKTVTTTDNYFILDKGDYLLSRNNNESEYAIIANNSIVSDFVLKTVIRIGPSENKKASIGIILKAQKDGKGAVIFEINKQGEYRIKQLVGSTYQTLSGKAKQEGWVRNKLINGVDEHNFIEIRSENNIYDVYTNSKYLTTFFIADFTSGSCGLIISPETKARVSYYYINIKGENTLVANYPNDNTKDTNPNNDDLNKKIKLLEENNAKLNEINNEFKTEHQNISKLHQINMKHETHLEDKNQQIEKLNQRVNSKKNEVSNLNKKNTELASVALEQEKQIKILQSSVKDLRVAENEVSEKNQQLNKKISNLQKQISLEEEASSKLTNDLNNLSKSSNSTITKLNNRVKELEVKIDALTKNNNTLKADLSSVKAEKSELKKLEPKIDALTKNNNTLKADLSSIRADLSSAKSAHQETKNNFSEFIKNKKSEINKLTAELKKSNNELTVLRDTQEKHDDITSNLNAQITDLDNRMKLLTTYLNTERDKNTALQTTNEELKELFILKDFEINGVKPSEMIKQNTNIPPAPKVLKGNKTIYSVQFGVYMQEQPYSSIKDIDNVWHKNTDQGTFIYYSGEFNLPQEAAAHMNNLISKGYANAVVVTLTK